MDLRNLITTIFVEKADFETTTVFNKNDCSGHNMFMPIFDSPYDGWASLVVSAGQDYFQWKSVFVPDGKVFTIWYWDYESMKEVRYEVPPSRRDPVTGCTDISGENGDAVTFHAYYFMDDPTKDLVECRRTGNC